MFTGLVTEVGRVQSLRGSGIARLEVEAAGTANGVQIGDSVAVNGVCLTATSISGAILTFDAVSETLRRTNLGDLHPGDLVNLERPLKAGDEFGGHFVLGHVDGLGRILRLEKSSGEVLLEIAAEGDIMKYIVEKGSVAVDGISLTVAKVSEGAFSIAVIPHTMDATNLRTRKVGQKVNLETDIIGKYVERFVVSRSGGDESKGLSESRLREMGF